jgi:hypothetical protein
MRTLCRAPLTAFEWLIKNIRLDKITTTHHSTKSIYGPPSVGARSRPGSALPRPPFAFTRSLRRPRPLPPPFASRRRMRLLRPGSAPPHSHVPYVATHHSRRVSRRWALRRGLRRRVWHGACRRGACGRGTCGRGACGDGARLRVGCCGGA